MENIGLKSYAKNLELSLPIGKAYANLCPQQSNVILEIPLIEEMGVSFLFNYLKKNEKGSMGKGGHVSLFMRYRYNRIYNPDFTSDEYNFGEQNSETGLTLTEVEEQYPTYELKDKDNNTLRFVSPNFDYPTSFINSKNEETTYLFSGDYITITSRSKKTKLHLRSDKCIDQIEYSFNDILVRTVEITYQNDLLTKITFIHPQKGSFSVDLIHGSNSLVFKDLDSRLGREFVFDSNSGRLMTTNVLVYTSVPDPSNVTLFSSKLDISFSYDEINNITTVMCADGKCDYYFFERRNIKGNYYNSLYANEDGAISTNDINENFKPSYEISCNRAIIECAPYSYLSIDDFSFGHASNYEPNDIESLIVSNTARILESGMVNHEFSVNANGGDVFTLTCLAKTIGNSANVTLELGQNGKTFSVSNNWKLLCVKTNIINHMDTLHACIETTNNVVIAAIHLLENDYGSFYTYDNSNGELKSDGKCTITNTNGMISNIVDGKGFRYGFEYNEQKDLIRFRTLNGVVVENDYNNDHQIIEQRINGKDNSLRFRKEYDEFGRLIFEVGDNPYNATTYGYDEFGSLTAVTKAYLLVHEKEYNKYGELQKIIAKPFNSGVTEQAEATFIPDNKNPKRIKHVQINNGSRYSFNYDDLNRITELLANNVCVFKYTYIGDSTQISRQYFGTSSDYFQFAYNDRGDIISFVHSSGNPTYQYDYDEYHRLTEVVRIRNGVRTTLERYYYDAQSKIVKVENDTKQITKVVDNNNKEVRNKGFFNGKEIIHEYDSVERAIGSNPELVIDEIQKNKGYGVATFVTGNNSCIGSQTVYTCHYRKNKNNANYLVDSIDRCYQLFDSSPSYDENIPYHAAANRIAYVVKGNQNTLQTVAFWFKADSHVQNGCLFFTKSRNGGCSIGLYERKTDNGRYYFEVLAIDRNGHPQTVMSTNDDIVNPGSYHYQNGEWTFISLTFGTEYKNNQRSFIAKLRINGVALEKICNQINYTWSLQDQRLEMNFGYEYVYNVTDNQIVSPFNNTKLTLIAIGKRQSIDDSLIDDYYRKTKDYIVDNTMNGEYNTADCSITRLIKAGNSNFGTFKVFPLENNLFSLDYDPSDPSEEDVPSIFDYREGYKSDKDTVFNYDKLSKKYVFVADGKRLAYKTRLGNSGTIAASLYFDDVRHQQYLFDVKSSGTRVSLIVDGKTNGLGLVVDNNNGSKHTDWISWFPNDNSWHNIALSFDRRVHTDYFGTSYTNYVRVMCDGVSRFEKEYTDISTMDDVEIMLGRSFTAISSNSNNVSESVMYGSLSGRISNFFYNRAFNAVSTINNVFTKLSECTSKVKYYDDLGNVKKEEISKGADTIFSKTYEGVTTVWKECFAFKNLTEETREYSYDRLNNLSYMSSSANESYNYIYDYQGFLMNEEYYFSNGSYYMNYSYDSNGNILSRSNDNIDQTFSYIGDKLVSVNNNPIFYSQTSPGNIESFGNWEFLYEGRRLRKATFKAYRGQHVINKKEVIFDYNEKGLRTSKVYIVSRDIINPSTGQVTNTEISRKTYSYEYDGNDLVYEKSDDKEIFYLYDENKQLYGYILNGSKYFYIKDIFNNILGLVDENGNVVAKYIYGAYGNLIHSEGSVYNPIRYKGYYFDDETGFFYCKSRYYVPELCRWLNMDNPAFLEMDDITKMNLFSYCHGNPVMYYDPDGHFGFLVIVALLGIAALAGAGSQLIANAISGKKGKDLWRGVVGAALGSVANAAMLLLAPMSGGASLVAAAWMGALITTGVNRIESTMLGEKTTLQQECINLLLNFGGNLLGNFLGAKLIPVNSGWFQPKHLLSLFTKPYGQRLLAQVGIGALANIATGLVANAIDYLKDKKGFEWFKEWLYA